MAVKISEALSSARHQGIWGSSVLVIEALVPESKEAIIKEGLLREGWAVSEPRSPPLLPIIALPATTSLMPHQACYFTKKTVAIRQPPPNFLLPNWQTHLHPHPPSRCLWNRRGSCCGGHSFHHGLLTASVGPMSFLAPSLLCIDGLKLPTLGCWHLMVFLSEILFPTWPSFPGQVFGEALSEPAS